jgi:MOSC domain-containing protein YiiM
MSQIHSIVYTPVTVLEKSPDHYDRAPLQEAVLIAGHGINGDRKGGTPKRQLNIMCYETLQGLGGEGFHVAPGEMGEQIVLSGIDLIDLTPGSRVQFGDSAVIEVVEPRNGCDRFEHIQGKAPALAKRRLGVMACVVASGAIKVGDAVKVVEGERVVIGE